MSAHLTQHLSKLTGSRAVKEPAIQTALQTVLESFGEVIREYQTGDGPCDLFLPARRVVIETKERSGKGKAPTAGPNLPGSKEGETQFQQVERYVLALRQKEQGTLWGALADNNTHWVGALTDGVNWWAWEWPTSDQGSFARPFGLLHEQSFEGTPEALHGALEALAIRQAGKPWVPANPADLFKPLGEQLTEVWAGAASNPSAETQHRLWDDLIRGSGIEVAEHRRVSLFLDHCLLVMLARDVTRVLDNLPYLPPSDGFVSWIAEAPGGAQWASGLFKVVDRYDWGLREADVLRNVYMEIVPKADRKLYGEYYTPDWLAHLIVEETLDEDWLKNAILAAHSAGVPPKGIGVLDPTCGSGTFLFHAARRIAVAIPKYLPSSDPDARAKITSHLVHGIDIHPIAVEMSRATVRRALPAAAEPSVHQGDALLMADTEASGLKRPLFDPDDGTFSPDGVHAFGFPDEFTDLPDYSERLNSLVRAARDGAALPAPVTLGMADADVQRVVHAHEQLTEVVADQGDGVWSWYIRNQLMPRSLARRKVDRIVSNPPWLRWSEIRSEPRKSAVRDRAQRAGILPGGHGARSSFDLGALFPVETRKIYLASPDRDPSAFVLNAAALRSDNWKPFRDRGHARGILDLTDSHADGRTLKTRPFKGANACVIGLQRTTAERLVLVDDRLKVSSESPELPSSLVTRVPQMPELPWRPSQYAARAHQGANIFPFVCVRVDPSDPTRTWQPSRAKPPWSHFKPFPLHDVPSHWRVRFVEPKHLLAFTLGEPLATAIIPNGGSELLSDDDARSISSDWRRISDVYRQHCGSGASTPKDLASMLNYRRQLESQTPPQFSVLYNKSGQVLRAATATAVIENKLYRVAVSSQSEGDYLCAVLNSRSLAFAFRFARKSGRDFDKTPLARVPIPLFRPAEEQHQQLAELGGMIRERRAVDSVVQYPEAFHDMLAQIDAIVKAMLPEFCR